ncbi:glycoside hydrolase family 132 protein [Sporormia fimetaria CBS 119925]|uniref:Glycoside hydrolase family 132 protein n=1 Tax=Sporormia fimetaria CBS 119925 TaxID=1340428 RepID=A0A6A6V944_9PLEO|nr:glycoside hydrolase family 132 protein [Sporormia fimetaria CBS 119925]
MRLVLVLLAAAVSVSAHPRALGSHHRFHRAAAKRAPPAPEVTVVVYELNGQPISEAEVQQGIANGTLWWGEDGKLSTSTSSVPTPTILPVDEGPAQNSGEQPGHIPNAEVPADVVPSSTTHSASTPSPPPQHEPNPEYEATPPSEPSGDEYAGIDKPFLDDKVPCNKFPEGYGAQAVGHAGLGGWIGIQAPGYAGANGFDDIMTVPHGSCSDGGCCTPKRFCSYSCPPGYLKTAWPEKQGVTKQSVGGLYCNANGKLEMPVGSIAKTLCVKGTEKVTIKVENKLSQVQSICRTDYPGTESETIPITTQPGESKELACPDNSKYYRWDGKPTSAQYYINPEGVSEDKACEWSDGSRDIGNWAPVNLGAGFDAESQTAYISLFPNAPTNPDARLNFTVELKADAGMSGRCKYFDGRYLSGDNYEDELDPKGCTVGLRPGSTLTVVLTNN